MTINSYLHSKKTPKQQGHYFECIAKNHLMAHGLNMIKSNYYCRHGEIDLIAIDHHQLIFIEVKFRSNDTFMPLEECIPPHKRQKIIKSAQHYVQEHLEFSCCDLRFDVVLLTLSKSTFTEPNSAYGQTEIQHMINLGQTFSTPCGQKELHLKWLQAAFDCDM